MLQLPFVGFWPVVIVDWFLYNGGVNSDDYEKLVASTIRDLKLAGSKNVYHQREFTGKRTGRKIKVDVSFELELHKFTVLCIVECKWYRHKVDVSEVEEFHTKLDDIGAHKGMMFTTVGYKQGAVKVAKAYGIALARLSDSPMPGDILAITNAVGARKPPSTRVAGELLSGAVYASRLGCEYWQWFPCGKALLNELYLDDSLSTFTLARSSRRPEKEIKKLTSGETS